MNHKKLHTIEEIANALKTKLELCKSDKIKHSLICNYDKNHQLLNLLKINEINNCQRCKLCDSRKNIVFGSGNPNAKLVFIGEAPGEEEDLHGIPFIGRSGQLLDKMIQAINLTRQQVYICNIIKCRPPKNRNPYLHEIETCRPFLTKQLQIINPSVIVTLGYFACRGLLNLDDKFSNLRGNWMNYHGINVMPTFHPAYLLRNPCYKRETWEHLKRAITKL